MIPILQTLLKWSEPFRKLGVCANADIAMRLQAGA